MEGGREGGREGGKEAGYYFFNSLVSSPSDGIDHSMGSLFSLDPLGSFHARSQAHAHTTAKIQYSTTYSSAHSLTEPTSSPYSVRTSYVT